MNHENNTNNKTNWLYLVLAFFIAAGIWAISDDTQTALREKSIRDIPIEYVGEKTTLANRGLMLLPDSDTEVSIRLKGIRTTIADLDPDEVGIRVDLSGVVTTGRQNVLYTIVYPTSSDYFSTSLTNVSESNTVSINIGALSRKSVEIRYDIRGNVADGYIAGEIQLQPDQLEIQGNADEVNAVAYAGVVLNIDHATETISEKLDYVLYDKYDQPVVGASLRTSTDKIQLTMPVNMIKEIPLEIDLVEDVGSRLSNVDWKLQPTSITVYGDASALESIDRILLDTVVLAGLNGDTTFNYVIPLPEGCENISGISRAELKLSFRDLLIKEVPTSSFFCLNQPAGKVVKVLTSQLNIVLRGTSTDIGKLLPEDVMVVADLGDISSASGNYTVPAEVQLRTNGDIAIIGTYQIRVNISEPPPPPPVEPEPGTEPGDEPGTVSGTEPGTGVAPSGESDPAIPVNEQPSVPVNGQPSVPAN